MERTSRKKLSTLLSAGILASVCEAQPFEPREPFGETYGAQWNLVRNVGQTFDLDGHFRADVAIQSVGTTPSLYLFNDSHTGFTYANASTDEVSRIDLTFVGENSHGVVPALYHHTGMVYNFYEEQTPDGITGVHAGKHAIYEGIYPYVDFHVLSNPWGPKFYVVLRPGADPDDLVMQVSGHDSLLIDITGDLKIWFENRFLRLKEGYAYQQVEQTIVNVPWLAHYENNSGSANVTFELGEYDPTLPLILCIKPWLPPAPPTPPAFDPEWSTYFPGIANDVIKDLTHDGDGNIYFTRASRSTNGLPISIGTVQQNNLAGEFDMIIGKVNTNYEIETEDTWMTYFGSAVSDHGIAIAYSSQSGGRLAVCGPSAINNSEPMTYPMGDSWTNSDGFDLLALFDPALGIRTYCTHLLSGFPGYDTFSGPADLDYDVLGTSMWSGLDTSTTDPSTVK